MNVFAQINKNLSNMSSKISVTSNMEEGTT